ncbi:MAG: amidohydrolase family protein [Gammaproteobacteria bacterium]|nr:amidohydrolase family protein [Gammaproteobacteria bacterium]
MALLRRAEELGVPLTVHTGIYVVPQPGSHCDVRQLDDVMLAFPDLKVIAYHAGWPDTEALIGLCGKHVNLYMSLSGIIGWYQRAPYRGYHAIGTAMQWMPADKIVLGLDLPFDDTRRVVDYIRDLEMPEELQKNWGYAQPTREEGQDTRPEPRPAHRHRSGEAQLTTRPGPGGPGFAGRCRNSPRGWCRAGPARDGTGEILGTDARRMWR